MTDKSATLAARLDQEFIETLRPAFEAFIGAPPHELPIGRWPNDPIHYAWPGAYRHVETDMAWVGFQAGFEATGLIPGCAECARKSSDGWALYCVDCALKFAPAIAAEIGKP